MNELALDLHDVTKIYRRRVRALSQVQMQVRRGEIFGLLGPNGAGKSTLVKIIMSVVRPTEARGTVLGQPIGSKASLLRAGYLPEHHRFPRYLTGRQILEFFAALSGVEKRKRTRRAAELLETVGMSQWADRKVATYSKGMMQRIGVAGALMNDPQLVILDEPTDGVDPVGRREIRDVLLRMREEGRSVFVNSHLLSELEMIADRVAILVGGRVVRQGSIDAMTIHRQYFELEVVPGAEALMTLRALVERRLGGAWAGMAEILKGTLADGTWIEMERAVLRIGTVEAPAVQPVIDAVRAEGLVIRRLQAIRPSLEELFLEAVGGAAQAHQVGAASGPPVVQPPSPPAEARP